MAEQFEKCFNVSYMLPFGLSLLSPPVYLMRLIQMRLNLLSLLSKIES